MKTLFFLISIFIATAAAEIYRDEFIPVVELSGQWKFEIGDEAEWSEPGFNDNTWENVEVPSSWEDEGFPGYDGIAWYRKSFFLPLAPESGGELFLMLGYIDDCDEVYINGFPAGYTGRFPPNYETAYNRERAYYIPNYLLKFGQENHIAIRIFDEQLAGGIVKGEIGLFQKNIQLNFEMKLEGEWQFKIGDEMEWVAPEFDDSQWEKLLVPLAWDMQGYRDYDGYGWYRLHFRIPEYLSEERLILLLGKIDDMDEVFLNGERIGGMGPLNEYSDDHYPNEEFRKRRAYYIPGSVCRFGRMNTLAVRVYDHILDGGIYTGPVGIATRKNYMKWKNQKKFGLEGFLRSLFNPDE